MRKHGMSKTLAYTSWSSMRERCLNPNSSAYRYYGAKGVTVCERWNDFEAFFADMGDRTPELSLDRIDPNGNYEPSNCRWATRSVQGRNQRSAIKVGAVFLRELCEDAGLLFNTVYFRIQRGETPEQALTGVHRREKKTQERVIEFAAMRRSGMTNKQIGSHFGLSESTMQKWAMTAIKQGIVLRPSKSNDGVLV